MAPRRTGQTSPSQSSSKGKKGKDRESNTEDASHSGSDRSRRSGTKAGQSTYWTPQDEDFLLESVLANRAMMGDGQMFRPAFWTDVASKFPQPVRGGVKTAHSCKEKWKRMKSIFEVVHKISNTSGLAYSLEKGAAVKPECQHVWDEIIRTTKGAAKFKHKGWVHYEKMLSVVKSKGTGNHKNAPLHTVGVSAPVSHSGPSSAVSSFVAPSLPPLPTYSPPSSTFPPPFTSSTSRAFSPPSSTIPPSPDFLPPSVPSSYIGSSASSLKPSSSVSARVENSGKRRADDDDISMVSAAQSLSKPAASMVSGTSSSSRKRRATQKAQEIGELRDDINVLQDTFRSNMELMRTFQTTSSKPAPAPAPSSTTSPQTTSEAAVQRKKARTLLLQLDRDFLTPADLVVMFDIFGLNNDCVDAYIVLASTENMDEVRQSWLKKRIAETSENT